MPDPSLPQPHARRHPRPHSRSPSPRNGLVPSYIRYEPCRFSYCRSFFCLQIQLWWCKPIQKIREIKLNLFFIQSSAYTESIGHITLTYNYEQEDVVQTACEWIEANEIKNKIQTINPTIQQIVNSYNQECEGVANEVLARNVDGEFSSSREYPNLMCKAIMDQCIIEGHNDVILSYVNKARDSNYNYTWTYADLYQAFPFDNTVYITEITGDELLRQVKKYNYICRNSSYTNNEINRNSKYKIAVLDYLYFHTDEYRDYDYFPTSADTSTITLTKNYREILRDWLRAGGYTNGGLKASDYSNSLWQFNRNAFVEA